MGYVVADPIEATSCHKNQVLTSNGYDALLWYRNSIERKIISRQIFDNALDQINNNRDEAKLKSKTWGVIFALDGTLLDISDFYYRNALKCADENPETKNEYYVEASSIATPGAKEISCGIQKLGGYVIIVSNRDGRSSGKNIVSQTEANLKQQKICYDSVIFANNSYDTDKNPRFTAVSSGDYENVVTSKQLPALKIIAYLGNDISDFPDFKQNTAKNLPYDSTALDDFGDSYFMLPNPLFGGWQSNRLQ